MDRLKPTLFASLAAAFVCAIPSFFLCIMGIPIINGTGYFVSGMSRRAIDPQVGYIMIWSAVGLMVIPAIIMGVAVLGKTFLPAKSKKETE